MSLIYTDSELYKALVSIIMLSFSKIRILITEHNEYKMISHIFPKLILKSESDINDLALYLSQQELKPSAIHYFYNVLEIIFPDVMRQVIELINIDEFLSSNQFRRKTFIVYAIIEGEIASILRRLPIIREQCEMPEDELFMLLSKEPLEDLIIRLEISNLKLLCEVSQKIRATLKQEPS